MSLPLVLLHGFLGSDRSWDAVVARLPRRTVLCPPLPGHGAELGETFEAAVAQVPLPPGSVLAGYSLGGRLALHAALASPSRVAGLLLIGAHPGLAEDARSARAAADEAWARRFESEPLERVVDDWRAQPIFASQAGLPSSLLDAQRGENLQHDGPSLAGAMRQLGLASMPDATARLASLRMPVVLLTGALDEKFSALAEAMARRLPDARHERVAGAGHNLLLEAPAEVAAALAELSG